ncbi:MAG: hypothetical protein R3E96_01350 [Planctomycetota bacterium]
MLTAHLAKRRACLGSAPPRPPAKCGYALFTLARVKALRSTALDTLLIGAEREGNPEPRIFATLGLARLALDRAADKDAVDAESAARLQLGLENAARMGTTASWWKPCAAWNTLACGLAEGAPRACLKHASAHARAPPP